MTITLTPPPVAMSDAQLRQRITHLSRAVDHATEAGRWLDAENYEDALDACHRALAERSSPDLDALARDADLYGEVVYAEIAERR